MLIVHLCIDDPATADRLGQAVRLAGMDPRAIDDAGLPALIIADGPLPGGSAHTPLVILARGDGPEAQAALNAGAHDILDPRTPLPFLARRLQRLVGHRASRGANESFLHRVTHDLKSPLLNLKQMARFLVEDEPALTAGGRRFAERIASNAARLTGLVERLARLADLGQTSLRILRCDPGEVLRQVAVPLGLEVALVEPLPAIWVDPGRFTQLLEELVHNAAQAGASRLRLRAIRETPLVELELSDDGPGLPSAQLQRVLEPLVRLSRDEDRAGLGLTIAQQVARLHDGDLWLSRPLGGGLAVHITVPPRG